MSLLSHYIEPNYITLEQERNLFKTEIESMVRDCNLSLILGSLKLDLNIKRLKKGNNIFFNKKYWSIIENYKKSCIITGSSSLVAYGILDRDPRDIDLIMLEEDKKFNSLLLKDRYKDDMDSKDMYGYTRLKGYYVDFFPYKSDVMYTEINGYKVQHPFQVIQKKLELYMNSKLSHRQKDKKDLLNIKNILQTLDGGN